MRRVDQARLVMTSQVKKAALWCLLFLFGLGTVCAPVDATENENPVGRGADENHEWAVATATIRRDYEAEVAPGPRVLEADHGRGERTIRVAYRRRVARRRGQRAAAVDLPRSRRARCFGRRLVI